MGGLQLRALIQLEMPIPSIIIFLLEFRVWMSGFHHVLLFKMFMLSTIESPIKYGILIY